MLIVAGTAVALYKENESIKMFPLTLSEKNVYICFFPEKEASAKKSIGVPLTICWKFSIIQ